VLLRSSSPAEIGMAAPRPCTSHIRSRDHLGRCNGRPGCLPVQMKRDNGTVPHRERAVRARRRGQPTLAEARRCTRAPAAGIPNSLAGVGRAEQTTPSELKGVQQRRCAELLRHEPMLAPRRPCANVHGACFICIVLPAT
jgi:hypothetical protein